tara:strand:- start:6165 stop:8813 length:2649 start_codon:yes stop_codon:yes gene_type:complete
MEGGALFNPGFIGGNFIWWIGRIADNSSWRDNELSGKFQSASQIPGFGKRYKVRIMGVHDASEDEIPSDQLPWANIMYPVTAGGGQGGSYQTANLRQGMFVFGFYMDGQDMQVPVIMGVLGNNAQTALETKIGKGDTNFDPTSGFAQGQEDIKGPAKSLPMDEGKAISKPKDATVSDEEAILSGVQGTNQFGLPLDKATTKEQQKDLESARSQFEQLSSDVKEYLYGSDLDAGKASFIKDKVLDGMRNRVAFANSPGSPARPGATLEGVGSMMQVAAADIKLEDKYREKTIIVVPDKVVDSSIKAIQTITENLTAKIEKSLSALSNYEDAVSGAPQEGDLKKLVENAACGMSKYMKVIMDKVMEYTNKTLNEEMTETVSAMPSCLRYQFADIKNVINQKSLEKYNNITDSMCGKLENILNNTLDIPNLIKAQKDKNNKNTAVGISTTVNVVTRDPDTGEEKTLVISRTLLPESTHPEVKACSAEAIVGLAIADSWKEINDANNNSIQGIGRYLEDVNSQLKKLDAEQLDPADDTSTAGAVLQITDEEVMDEVRGGTKYKTMTKVGVEWRTSTVPERTTVVSGFTAADATGEGLLVDIIVPTGGLGGTGSGSIDFSWVNQGTGYTNTNAVNCVGGSGTGMKVNLVTSGGEITNIFTHTTGTGYKKGEELEIQSGNFDARFRLTDVWGRIQDGGITVNKRGLNYFEGDVYVVLNGSDDATFMIISVDDPGDGEAKSSDPSKPQQLANMIPSISSLTGNLTSALNFENITANIFPFELPPNSSPVDYVTLVNGGDGQSDGQLPSVDTIRKNVDSLNKDKPFGLGSKQIPFRTPKVKQVIDLVERKVVSQGIDTSTSTGESTGGSTGRSSSTGSSGGSSGGGGGGY